MVSYLLYNTVILRYVLCMIDMDLVFSKRPKLQCQHCLQLFDRASRLATHQSRRKTKCTHCSKIFCNDEIYQRHLRTIADKTPNIKDLDQKIQPETAYGSDAGYQVYRLGKISEITDWEKHGENYTIKNTAINQNFTYNDLYKWLKKIYKDQKTAFKISLGFGFVLFNPISKEYKYFYVSDNNSLFETAWTIASKKDLERLMKKIISLDLTTNCYLNKPSSGWTLCSITNVQAKITNLPETLIGGGALPLYIQKSKSIIGLTHLRGEPYEDNLCAYRCIALHHGLPKNALEKYTKHLLEEFEKFRGTDWKGENGITIYDIPLLELYFKIPINVYTLNKDGTVDVIYLTTRTGKPLYMNLYEKHFSYISKIDSYGKNFRCSECDRIFNRPNNLKRHMKTCQTEVTELYTGGKFDASLETVFDKLEKIGIVVPEEDRYYKYVSVFDFEAIQVPDETRAHGRDYHFIHIPATFSVCSNIDGFKEPVHVQSEGSPQKLVDELVKLQLQHQEAASRIMRKKFDYIFEELASSEDEKSRSLKFRLERYCDQLPVITFNGSGYDLPLIREYLLPALDEYDELPTRTIKRGRKYTLLATNRLKYLDLTSYLAAGTSLAKFYAAYKVSSPKGYFPYEYFSSLSKLKEPGLPKRTPEAREKIARGENVKGDPYYSILKQKTISNESVDLCEKVYEEQGMKTFGDFVKYYNDLDVIGLVQGIEKMHKVYSDQKLDMFKDAISLPKLAQIQIFRPLKDDYFTTFSKRHSHIFREVRGGIVGGPSIVFNRYQERGVTKIKGREICQNVLGFDCNAMYLECMGKEQCTGPYCLREKRLGFKKHSRRDKNFILYSEKAINWLRSIERERGIRIRTAESNPHGEKRIGNCYVDGYYNNTIFEFLGCYFHGHDCDPKNRLHEWGPTQKRLQKFRDMGYKVETILECEWNKNKRATRGAMKATVEDMVQGISSGEIFGLVKCSLHVPPEKIDYFTDFPPIFKNTKIDLEDIGPHMQQYAKEIGRKKGVEKCLISSMFGNNIVILSTLFKRYLDLGLVCTDIEWVIEYNGKPVFQWFTDKVSNDRRRADLDPDLAIIGETSKTCGNASYGYCAMDKTKHNNVLFCKQDKVSKHLRDPFFKSIEELGGGICEIVKSKRKIVQDTPIQVAIAVYSRAKMLLLDFWVFLKEHLDDSTYCLMETDTDSLYIAISKDTIDECVRPDKLDDWKKRKYEYFASDSEEPVTFEGVEISEKQYDKRTPGKFKLEFSGIGMICLNSKVYHIWTHDGEFKTSSKGMQSRNEITKENFLDVLWDKYDHHVENSGFIDDGTRKKTYTQVKKGLNYFYCKRIVLEDGVSTTHLNI